jgi:hypothetical protein
MISDLPRPAACPAKQKQRAIALAHRVIGASGQKSFHNMSRGSHRPDNFFPGSGMGPPCSADQLPHAHIAQRILLRTHVHRRVASDVLVMGFGQRR